MVIAFFVDVRGKRDHADPPDDGRARSPDADASNRGILRGFENPRCAHDPAAIQRRVSRNRKPETVKFHSNPALYDELVQKVFEDSRWKSGNPEQQLE